MNALTRGGALVLAGLILSTAPAVAQRGMQLGVGPVFPLGASADELHAGLHVETQVPFNWYFPPIFSLPVLRCIPLPHLPKRLDFLRPRLAWHGAIAYDQMAGPDRPYRVISGAAIGTRDFPRPASWFFSPYWLAGVGAYNTQFSLPSVTTGMVQHPATADVRTNAGLEGGVGATNHLDGYNVSLEAKYRYVRNALSDPNGTPHPMRSWMLLVRYTLGSGWGI